MCDEALDLLAACYATTEHRKEVHLRRREFILFFVMELLLSEKLLYASSADASRRDTLFGTPRVDRLVYEYL